MTVQIAGYKEERKVVYADSITIDVALSPMDIEKLADYFDNCGQDKVDLHVKFVIPGADEADVELHIYKTVQGILAAFSDDPTPIDTRRWKGWRLPWIKD
jgi:hypothetical protein